MSVDKERLFKKLDHVGEHVVRENLEKGVYGPNRRPLVEEWLLQLEEDEVESAPEVEHEPGRGAVESEGETAESTPPRKWYQRLFSRGRD